MITRILIVAVLVLSCSLCIAEDAPIDIWDWERTNEIKSLTVEQAAKLVEPVRSAIAPFLQLNGLTSIDKDVAQELVKTNKTGIDYWGLSLDGLTTIDKDAAQELAKFKGQNLALNGLTSIDKDVAQELMKFKRDFLHLVGLTSIDKDVAQELAKFKGHILYLNGLTSMDKDVAQELMKFKGRNYLELSHKTSIDKEALKILKSNPKIKFVEEYGGY